MKNDILTLLVNGVCLVINYNTNKYYNFRNTMVLNKVYLLGYVGQKPNVTNASYGKVANFSLATTESGYTTKSGTAIPDKTEWHNIVCYGAIADVVDRFVDSGTPLLIEGKLRTRSYEDKTKVKRWITEIVADNIQLLPKKQ